MAKCTPVSRRFALMSPLLLFRCLYGEDVANGEQ